jgi:hypothetical protein
MTKEIVALPKPNYKEHDVRGGFLFHNKCLLCWVRAQSENKNDGQFI